MLSSFNRSKIKNNSIEAVLVILKIMGGMEREI